MCGIVGAVGLPGPLPPDRRAAVLDALEHRGPDSVGEWSAADTWLGFRRLAIIDLRSVADQPMTDAGSGVVVVFNGEIYNYVELRQELVARGHVFRTGGDTEVVLRGYLEWGTDLFRRCNGMWAIAIQDPSADGVLLCRDRFGEKPLYVGEAGDGAWWFGSEVRTLRSAHAGSDRLDLPRTLGFLVFGDIEDPEGSYVDGIAQVAPGTFLRLTARGPGPATRFWDVASILHRSGAEGPVSPDEVLAALDDAVRIRLRSDVEVGTSLSGGVDSAAVVAGIRAAAPERIIHAFTSSFPGRSIDEFDRAALVAERHGVTLHRVEPTAEGLLEDLGRIVERQGGPIESPTVYAQWCVMRRAHEEGVTVLLDGQGADEMWGGYPKHAGFALLDGILRARPDESLSMARRWRVLGPVPRPPLAQAAGLLLPATARDRLRSVAVRRARSSLGPALDGVASADPQGHDRRGSLISRAARADVERVMLPRLLRYADRNSMAWSREVRLPFLDPGLVELGLRSDWQTGLSQGWTKLALRRAVEPRVPAEILWRREKAAYETPSAEWLRRPDVAEVVRESQAHLVGCGVLAPGAATGLDPWRVITLSSFVAGYGLRT